MEQLDQGHVGRQTSPRGGVCGTQACAGLLAGMGGVAVEMTRKWAGLDERLPTEMKENSSPDSLDSAAYKRQRNSLANASSPRVECRSAPWG